VERYQKQNKKPTGGFWRWKKKKASSFRGVWKYITIRRE